jgi:hypothetical protein
MDPFNVSLAARCAALTCFALTAGLAQAVTLTCEGAVSKAENVEWGSPTIAIQVSFTEGAGGTLTTDDEMLGKDIALAVDDSPISINAHQLIRRQENGNSFGVSTLTISRKTGRFYMQVDLRSNASPVPLMAISWTGACEKSDPTKNKF